MSATGLKLYSYWRSSSAWRVRLGLEFKGLAYELIPVNIRPGADEQKTAAFGEVNAMAQVPVLELQLDGQTIKIGQSMAILDLLEALAPTPALYPTQPRARAFALEAAEIVNAAVQPFQNLSVQARVSAMGGSGMAFAQGFVRRGLGVLEHLAKQRAGHYCVGDEVTIADVLLVPQLHSARRLSVSLADFPMLTQIEARCAALDAFVRAHPDSQPDRIATPD
jgi:maleylpyruvate isomerase